MENMSNSSTQSSLYIAAFGNAVSNGMNKETNSNPSSLPPFEDISQPLQEEETKRDILMPIQQNIIGSSNNFTQIQSTANGSMSPLSKSSNSLFGSTSSSVFSTSSEEGPTRSFRGKRKNCHLKLFHEV